MITKFVSEDKLIPDYKRVLRKAWSIRLMILAGALSGVEVILSFTDVGLSVPYFAALSGLVTMAAFVTRLLAQNSMKED